MGDQVSLIVTTGAGMRRMFADDELERLSGTKLAAQICALNERTLWGSLNHVTYGNSDVETSLLDPAGKGSLVVPAGTFVPGRTLRYECRGVMTCGNGQSSRFKLKLDGVDLIDNLGTLPNNLANAYVEAQFDIFCHSVDRLGRATVEGSGRTLIQTVTGIGAAAMRSLIGADSQIDSNVGAVFDHTLQWTAADPGNTVTIQRAQLRILT